MDTLEPPILTAVREVRWAISSGQSMNESMRGYFENSSSTFAGRLRSWWLMQTQSTTAIEMPGETFWQQQFLEIIRRGRAGQPVLDALKGLEGEIEIKARAELETHLASLPFKVLIPLLLFQFPAYLILLLGPLLRELQNGFGS